ncbi:unnamed protein product [Adineta steineri]|uniref:Uncharacterized protein n=1 Tax=Adineta steineri TaxID=433720 RepID=A0A820LT37_9BILA|nr:unnamed protein product [Adineta steineri]
MYTRQELQSKCSSSSLSSSSSTNLALLIVLPILGVIILIIILAIILYWKIVRSKSNENIQDITFRSNTINDEHL